MLNRYRRDAESILELNLGWLAPLHEAIPELATMEKDSSPNGEKSVEASVTPSTDDSSPVPDSPNGRVLH